MWPAALTRLLKRRLVYIILTIIIIVYTVKQIFHKRPSLNDLESEVFLVERTKPLLWRTLQEHVLPNDTDYHTNPPHITCRNSEQGKYLLTDDRGFVCNAEHLLANGCCNTEMETTKYYTCESCNHTTHCCGIYEYCISCCLHPDKKDILELALANIKGRQTMLYAQVNDQYELCLFKCRTNSHSVEHENRYRDAKHRFCYGITQAHESQLDVAGTGS